MIHETATQSGLIRDSPAIEQSTQQIVVVTQPGPLRGPAQ